MFAAGRLLESSTSTAGAEVEELGDDVPDEFEDLSGSDERRSDPQTKLSADVAHQRRHTVLRTLNSNEHLLTVATPCELSRNIVKTPFRFYANSASHYLHGTRKRLGLFVKSPFVT